MLPRLPRRLSFEPLDPRLLLDGSAIAGQDVSGEAVPAIEITAIPEYGTAGFLQGKVQGVDFTAFRVAPFIQIEGLGWWTKPTFASPTVPINTSDGTFAANVVTGGLDDRATILCAALVPAEAAVPLAQGSGRIPADLPSVAMDCQERYARTLEFAGRTWAVKEAPLPVGPGDNSFSAHPDDVFVDDEGLHLTITFRDGAWRATEVILLDELGYGTYAFQTSSRVDQLDANVTFGAFTWDPYGDDESGASPHREIDFEDARWGNAQDPTNAQIVVQPYDVPGNLLRYTIPDLDNDPSLTRFFDWQPEAIDFVALHGHRMPLDYSPADVIFQHTYLDDPEINHHVPTEGSARFRFNLWLIDEASEPAEGEQVEVVIRDFLFIPPDHPPWQNPVDANDVNNDGFVSPLDALLVINRLNSRGPGSLSVPPVAPDVPPPFVDTNGDGFLSPIDALLVINFLNRRVSEGGEGEAHEDILVSAHLADPHQVWPAVGTAGGNDARNLEGILGRHFVPATQLGHDQLEPQVIRHLPEAIYSRPPLLPAPIVDSVIAKWDAADELDEMDLLPIHPDMAGE